MNDIRRVLRAAAWRLFLTDLIRTAAMTATVGLIALILAVVVERVFGLTFPWRPIFIWTPVAAGAGAVVWSIVRRTRGVAVARTLDERAGLRESLSTALCVERSDDPWAMAVVETARDRARTVQVKRAIPIIAPRMWPVPMALGLSFAVVWLVLPTFDALGLLAKRETVAQDEQRVVQVKAEVKAQEQKLEELLTKANLDLKGEAEDADAPEATTPEEIQKAAIKRLTSLTDRMNEAKGGEKAQQMEAMKQAMEKLKQPGPGPLAELSRQMARGDFAKAQEQLDELSRKLNDGSLSDEQKQQMKEQLAKMSQQLDKAAKDQEAMQKKLEQAGMDKDTAKKAAADPEALKKALDELATMSEDQKQELLKMAAAQAKAGAQCEGMAGAMAQMAQGMGKQGMSQEGMEGMEGLAGQLGELEMLSEEMEGLDAAMSEAAGQLASLGGMCQGDGECDSPFGDPNQVTEWKSGDTNRMGWGSGGPGRSHGGVGTDEEEAAFDLEKKKAPTKTAAGGTMIGSRLVYGDQVRGESVAEFSEAVESGSKAATEAIETQQVERRYQPVVKNYFGRLEKKGKPGAKGDPPAAQPAQDAGTGSGK